MRFKHILVFTFIIFLFFNGIARSQNSVQADLGTFLLIKRIDDTKVALKLTEYTRPRSKDGEMLGVKYIVYVFSKSLHNWTKYSGEVYEPDGGGVADNIYIVCDTFRIEWSRGNWIYFTESMSAMAKSQWNHIDLVNFDDNSLEWIQYVPPWKK